MTTIKKFTILGERCSGTNFLQFAIEDNFDLPVTWEYGHKHFFGFNDFNNSDDTLFIGIVRNIEDWLMSLKKDHFHLYYHIFKTWQTFLTGEFWSYDTLENMGTGPQYEVMKDRNMNTGERYKNIFELRKVKNDFLLNKMPYKVKNYILIRYEDLRDKYEDTINEIQQKFGLRWKNEQIKKIDCSRQRKGIWKRNYYKIPQEVKNKIKEGIDYDLETMLGYRYNFKD